jgi:hypothetical protein
MTCGCRSAHCDLAAPPGLALRAHAQPNTRSHTRTHAHVCTRTRAQAQPQAGSTSRKLHAGSFDCTGVCPQSAPTGHTCRYFALRSARECAQPATTLKPPDSNCSVAVSRQYAGSASRWQCTSTKLQTRLHVPHGRRSNPTWGRDYRRAAWRHSWRIDDYAAGTAYLKSGSARQAVR